MTQPTRLFQLNASTGNLDVFTPGGLLIASLSWADQLALLNQVSAFHLNVIMGRRVNVDITGPPPPTPSLHVEKAPGNE